MEYILCQQIPDVYNRKQINPLHIFRWIKKQEKKAGKKAIDYTLIYIFWSFAVWPGWFVYPYQPDLRLLRIGIRIRLGPQIFDVLANPYLFFLYLTMIMTIAISYICVSVRILSFLLWVCVTQTSHNSKLLRNLYWWVVEHAVIPR